INLLAIVYTARLIGFELGAARALAAVAFSIIVGLIMAFIYGNEDKKAKIVLSNSQGKNPVQLVIFFVILVAILIFGAAEYISREMKIITLVTLLFALAIVLKNWFVLREISSWARQTYELAKMILPLLLLGIFVAGVLKAVVPESLISHYLGGNSLGANFIASFFGALMYFATLTEVPIVKALMDLGMGKGPALALLLAGPTLSLPSMLVIARAMGLRKTATYVMLVVFTATIAGFGFGSVMQ
ncbi:MAG: permease, partial [Candidatus Hydrothermarchaeota archaeon]|nr:permease [Candidatus Hydrothermarchaeota archaeon]